MIKLLKHIKKSSSYIRENPLLSSSIISEALFGEIFKIEKIQNDWVYGKLLTDDYQGWININDLGKYRKPTHRVIKINTTIYAEKNIKTAFMMVISYMKAVFLGIILFVD